MPAVSSRTPSYRHHKPSGQAVVTLSGRDVYLGKHGSPESRAEYDRLVAEWLSAGRRLPTAATGAASELSVNEVILAYLKFADAYYTKGGKPTIEPGNIRLSVRLLKKLYGHTNARDFGPLGLKAVRQAMIEGGGCRSEINRRVGRIVRLFKWATSEEMVPPSVHQTLQTVPGLRRGRADVRESKPVKPASEADVAAIRPHVARQVWAMIEVQRLSGMRPGEVVSMRTFDIDTSGRVWTYSPPQHKTEHHGKTRLIQLGPKAQAVLGPWLRPDPAEYLFSPAEAEAERKATLRAARKTPVQPSQVSRAKTKPARRVGSLYTVELYRRAIANGCKKAGVAHWHPHQLRHSAATHLRREFGIDVARAVLGYSSPAVTDSQTR